MTAHQWVYEALPTRTRYYVFWDWNPKTEAATVRIFDRWATEKRTAGTLYHEGEAYVGGLRKPEMERLLEDLAFGEELISPDLLMSPDVRRKVRFEWGRAAWVDADQWLERMKGRPVAAGARSPKDWEPKRRKRGK